MISLGWQTEESKGKESENRSQGCLLKNPTNLLENANKKSSKKDGEESEK